MHNGLAPPISSTSSVSWPDQSHTSQIGVIATGGGLRASQQTDVARRRWTVQCDGYVIKCYNDSTYLVFLPLVKCQSAFLIAAPIFFSRFTLPRDSVKFRSAQLRFENWESGLGRGSAITRAAPHIRGEISSFAVGSRSRDPQQ